MSASNIFLALIALIFPPLPVWVKRGLCSADSLINLALCCLGGLPGILHAWYIIFSAPDLEYEAIADPERGHGAAGYIVVEDATARQQTYGTPVLSQASAARSSTEVPPPYAEAIRGDHKVQTT